MSTNCTIYANVSAIDSAYGVGGTWVELDLDNDFLLFSAGSDSIKDGESLPSDAQISQAATLLTGVEQTVAHYFLADNSDNLLKEIFNMGEGNYRFVIGASFDNAVASEPVLEVWDDDNLNTIDNVCLGNNTPSSSFIRGICTTDALPGVSWVGSRLAGSSDGHYLNLNNGNGPLVGADILYFQLKVVLPATLQIASAEVPVFAIKYASV